MHQILLSRKAEKFLGALSAEDKAKVIAGILELSKNPVSGKSLSGRFDGYRSFFIYPFKIIFELQKSGGPVLYIIAIARPVSPSF
ncbi:MAG: type II toxin-antitoxin system RelE/ParE family toxin [Patescibacteria group bacterium]|nr:type II toxin-antitoxin system RelE/ParE family toxin [Patescibacteria group bacterium]